MSDRPPPFALAKQVLDDLLRALSFRAELAYHGQLCDAWSIDTSGTGKASFHVVCHGRCWLHMPDLAVPLALESGDVVVFPRDARHALTPQSQSMPRYGERIKPVEVPLDRTQLGVALVCGFLELHAGGRQLILEALPEYLVVRSCDGLHGTAMRLLLDLLFSEAAEDGIGAAALLERLADALFVYVIREAIRQGTTSSGLLAALADPQLGPAVAAMCRDPAQPLSVDTLAGLAHLSRSAFAERFHAVVGQPPIEFATVWRMQLACGWLERDRLSVPEVAERCGYSSEAAFAKAFKRVVGVGPGQVRRTLPSSR